MPIHQSLTNSLAHQHELINRIMERVSSTRSMLRPAADKWSIHDNIAHLARYQFLFIERLNRIQTEHTPAFERYKAEDDPGFEDTRKKNTLELLKSLREQRKKINELVLSYSDEQVKRTGNHPKFGNLTAEQWLEFFVLHEAHHIFTMFQLANDVSITD